MKKQFQNLLGLFIILGCAFYIYGIALACIKSWPAGPVDFEFRVFLSTSITSIAALLATNLGAVLGISITNPNSTFKKPIPGIHLLQLLILNQTNIRQSQYMFM